MAPGELVCIDCGTVHGPERARCPCGGALDHADAQGRAPLDAEAFQAAWHDPAGAATGVWRFADELGVPAAAVTTLGEGDTPLVADDVLGCSFKLEYTNPTGSFKDRGATVVVSRARALGAEHVVEDSSGNAGTAVAAYAARAGLGCTIFAPEHVTRAKRAQIKALGATVEVVAGPRQGVTEAAVKAADAPGTAYATHAYLPHFLDGCATMAYELVHQRGGCAPEAVVTPCAMGSVLLGLDRGFARLAAAGVIDQVPRLFAVQAAGFDPIARAVIEAGGQAVPGGGPEAGAENRLPDGLLIPHPPRLAHVVEAVLRTGGTSMAVDEAATRDALARLHRRGLLVEPSSAVTLAALDRLRGAGLLDGNGAPAPSDVVLVLTGRFKPD